MRDAPVPDGVFKVGKILHDPFYCPLCGFMMLMDWDNHFMPCFKKRVKEVRYVRI